MNHIIECKNVTLAYELFHDRSSTLKEYVINFFHRRKHFDEKAAVTKHIALNQINLTIREGDRLGIVGLNGAGKSTLLKVISGILKPTDGTVNVVGNIQPLIEVGAGFNPEFTGRDNIFLNAYMLGFTKEEVKGKEKEIIDFSELSKFIDVPVKYYSTGMAIRLAFTIATSIRPEILVIDEMLSAGDAAFVEKSKHRMSEVFNQAKIMVIVSHDLELVKSMSTRMIVLNGGRIEFEGTPEDSVAYYQNAVVARATQG